MLYIIANPKRAEETAAYLLRLPTSPALQVEIKPYKKNRSTSQNRLYWMWLNFLSEHTGSTPDELHQEMKVRFLGVEHIEVKGVHLILPKSTTTLTTKEFATLILEPLESLAIELGCALPIPDDYNDAMGYKRAA